MLHPAAIVLHHDAVEHVALRRLAAAAAALAGGTVAGVVVGVGVGRRRGRRRRRRLLPLLRRVGREERVVEARVALHADQLVERGAVHLLDGDVDLGEHVDRLARVERVLDELAHRRVQRLARVVEAGDVLVLREELGGRLEAEDLAARGGDDRAVLGLGRHGCECVVECGSGGRAWRAWRAGGVPTPADSISQPRLASARRHVSRTRSAPRSFGIAIMALALLTLFSSQSARTPSPASSPKLTPELDSSNFDKEVSRRPSQFVLPDRRNSARQNCAPCKRHLQKFTRSRHRTHRSSSRASPPSSSSSRPGEGIASR